ncbi:MAG: DUF6326 family protein [Actinomycetota bacterium]
MITWTNPPAVQHRMDRIERQARITALWLFVMLNLVVRDLHEIVKAEFLAEALEGTYNGREVTEVMFLFGGIIVAVPISMIALTWFLPRRVNRWANIGAAAFFGLFVVPTLTGDLDDVFHGALELIGLATIMHLARTWPTAPSTPAWPAT